MLMEDIDYDEFLYITKYIRGYFKAKITCGIKAEETHIK